MSAGRNRGTPPIKRQPDRGPINASRTGGPRTASKPKPLTVKKALAQVQAKLEAAEKKLKEFEAAAPARQMVDAMREDKLQGMGPAIRVMAGRRSWSIEDEADGEYWANAIRLAQQVAHVDRSSPVFIRLPAHSTRAARHGFGTPLVSAYEFLERRPV